jgi:restriction system protein
VFAPDPRFERLDAMSGPEFERAVAELFEALGHEVELIGGFDKGADLVLTKEGERTAVQAKRQSSSVGISAVRQLIDGRKRYDCTRGLVVTNSFFTPQAIECAETWEIDLWDRRELAKYVEGEPPRLDSSVCAECGASVTSGTTKWCLDQPSRYGGNVFCRKHQAKANRSAAQGIDFQRASEGTIASTPSMTIVRCDNRALWPSRTYLRRGREESHGQVK